MISIIPCLLAALLASPPAPTARAERPRLVVLLVVDQMRADYLDRFDPFLNGGLGRLKRTGRHYTAARHLHAATSTGPGHATLSTGSHPRQHGIISNTVPADEPGTFRSVTSDPTCKDLLGGRTAYSPRDLLAPSLGDWMKRADPRSKVVTLSFKSRAAILLGGHRPDACVWVDRGSGRMTSSSFYSNVLPDWVRRFNEQHPPGEWLGKEWTPRLDEATFVAAGTTPDDVWFEGRSGFSRDNDPAFPHPIQEIGDLVFTPYSDQRLLDLAITAVDEFDLGGDDSPDLLALSLSSADYIGHTYGPDSREICDYYAWLDAALPEFLTALVRAAGEQRVLLALSSDHGVSPIVEHLQTRGMNAGRIRPGTVVEAVDRELDERFGADDWAVAAVPDVHLNQATLKRRGIDAALARQAAAAAVKRMRGVKSAFTRERLASGDASVPESFHFNFHPQRSGDVALHLERYFFLDYLDVAPYVRTNHASAYRYDQRVPVLFHGSGVRPGVDADPIGTIDVAPTLARLIGVAIPDTVDGRALDLAAEGGR